MNRIKKFAKRRWHSIPVGAIALVASLLVGGVAFATVSLMSGTATVTVTEAITIEASTPTDGVIGGASWSTMTWTVGTYPLETKTLTIKLTNTGSAGIPIYATIGNDVNFTENIKVWDGAAWVAYGTSYTVTTIGYLQFEIIASGGAPVGSYTLNLGITR